MSMTKSWKYRTTQDKLCVFVSSRIQECSDERAIVKKAVRSLNHNPVLFEHLGAKIYSPRDLYLSRLNDSQVMVAIYRSGYGYIDTANGMKVSGLEDEYRFAIGNDIDTLFYIWHSADGREPRLQSLIDEISTSPTLAYYEKPEQLHDRVRDDVTALITDKFLAASLSYDDVILEDPDSVLTHTLKISGAVILRNDLIKLLLKIIKKSSVLCIYGKAGIGKTTISAQIAKELSGKYVRASNLAPKELFAVCANILKDKPATEATPYLTLEGARLALAAAWSETSCKTLIIDDCNYISELLEALSVGGEITTSKSVVYTSRTPSTSYKNHEIPVLTSEEINQFIEDNPSLSGTVAQQVKEATPLLLQTKLLQKEANYSSIIVNARGSAGEILKYLALSPTPLSAEQLIELRADNSYYIESLKSDIEQLGTIVDDSPRGYRLMHSTTANSITNEIKESPQLYRFFLNRLVLLMEKSKNYRYAYELAKELGENIASKYITRAIREATQLGDWRVGVSLIDQLMSKASNLERKSEALNLMLSLVYPLELMGDVSRADVILKRAKSIANKLGKPELLQLEEVELSSRVRRAMLASDIEDLIKIYHRYSEQEKIWDQARIGLELSAIYIAAKDYEEAEKILRPTLSTFKELGDDYGVDLAQKNLASTLFEIPGMTGEAEGLIALISEQAGDQQDVRRQHAWLCNVYTRRLRSARRYDEAEVMAKEAIEIAIDLGDESLRAINLVNLGNIYRDDNHPLEAITAYNEAATVSKKCGRSDIDADASRLIAGIYNDFEETGETKQARAELAKFFAQYAVGLVRDTISYDALANASWELSEAFETLGEIKDAAHAMFDAASALRMLPNQDNFSHMLNRATELSLPDHIDIYLRGITNSLAINQPDSEQTLSEQFLSLVVPIMKYAPKGALIHLLGNHLNIVWSKVPTPIRRGVVATIVNDFNNFAKKMEEPVKPWRVLYSAIVIATLMKDTKLPYAHHRLATSIAAYVNDIFVREEGEGLRRWTLILNLGQRVTVTIATLDSTPASNLAMFSLAMFMKAFEDDLSDLIGGEVATNELIIQIALFSEMPEDLRKMTQKISSGDNLIEDSHCTVSRPTGFGESSPTIIFLGASFLKDVSFGSQRGNSLPLLFGLTLIEIAYQLLRGEVEIETIRSKVVSLVRKAQP